MLVNSALPEFGAVIFDMDGLVMDSEPTYAYAWRQAAAEFGVELDGGFTHGLFGRHANDVERALAEKIGAAFDAGRFGSLAAQFWRRHVAKHGIAPMPGVDGLLALLERNDIPYALATNSDGPFAGECLRLGGLDSRFPWVVTRDQVAAGKPEPDLFLEAARRMGVYVGSCVVLEDSATGLIAARRAGAAPVLVRPHPLPEDLQALALASFGSLTEVAEILSLRFRPHEN